MPPSDKEPWQCLIGFGIFVLSIFALLAFLRSLHFL